MPDTELVNITINGTGIQVPKGEKVIESARRIGADIPFFCYHPRLSMEAGANCRMCLVEVGSTGPDGSVRMMPKPQASCSLPASEGLIINTETEALARDRRGVLEFLLINHPLDCPVCDRGGECPLQNNTLHYGPPTSRYIEEKRRHPKAYPLSEYVVFDRERCIQCARCTRFTSDISGDSQLAFLKRGADMEVGTFASTAFESRFSGNVIELCPVGALLSRTYRFKARPWDLSTQKSICTECGNGCNIKIDYRAGKLQRVNARVNEAVNEEWTCDRGKFGMGYVSSDERLAQPMVRRDGQLQPATWNEALALVVDRLREAGPNVGAIAGTRSSNEDLYLLQKLFRETLQSGNLDHRLGSALGPTRSVLRKRCGHHTMGAAIAEIESMRAILVFGSDLVVEQPMLYLRTRKAWRARKIAVVEAVAAGSEPESRLGHVRDFAAITLRYRPGGEVALACALAAAAASPDAAIASLAADAGVAEADIRKAAALLACEGMAIIAGSQVTDAADPDAVIDALADLAAATGNAANLNVPVTGANQQGAMDLGLLPDALPGYAPAAAPGMNTRQMLEAAASGALKVLWTSVPDLINAYCDRDLARRAVEGDAFVVVAAHFLSETAQLADVVLPLQTVAERDGTFTNIERRVQRFFKAYEPAGDTRTEWQIAASIASALGGPPPPFSARDILREIADRVGIYAGCTPQALGDQGLRWSYPQAGGAALPDTTSVGQAG